MNTSRTRQVLRRGFTLVELMIVVVIIGVLAAMAVVGYSRFMRSAKTAEAKNALGAMARGNLVEYDHQGGNSTVVPIGTSGTFSNVICDSAAASVPSALAAVAGKKYQSSTSEWRGPDALSTPTYPHGKGFSCLRFSIDTPQSFMYSYSALGYATDTATFEAVANGDLNGDSVASTFRYRGAVTEGHIIFAPTIAEDSPDE